MAEKRPRGRPRKLILNAVPVPVSTTNTGVQCDILPEEPVETKNQESQCFLMVRPPEPDKQPSIIKKHQSSQCCIKYNTSNYTRSDDGVSQHELIEIQQKMLTCQFFQEIITITSDFSTLECSVFESHLEIIRRGWLLHNLTREPPARVRIFPNGDAFFLIVYQNPRQLLLKGANGCLNINALHELLCKLDPKSGYLFCTGIKPLALGTNRGETIKSFEYPFIHHQSNNCEGLFKALRKYSVLKNCGFGTCSHCLQSLRLIVSGKMGKGWNN